MERNEGFPIGLNTSTLRGHKLPITEVIDITAATGYAAIEPWADELDQHITAGGTIGDLERRLQDHGLAVTGGIAFFEWMVDSAVTRDKAIDEAKRRLEQFARISATHIAAPPLGDVKNVELPRAAERYRTLLELAEPFGVIPVLEIWGFADNIFRLDQAVEVVHAADHPHACLLADVYHLYKGGSGFAGIRDVPGKRFGGFHMNDYPADPPRERIGDEDRVYPGDGIAPLIQLLRNLRDIHYAGVLSIELFNPTYYKQDPKYVAQTAIDKTKAVIARSIEV